MVTKQRVIMHRDHAVSDQPGLEFFWEEREQAGHTRLITLSRGDFLDMGSPETVTVSIEPGDLLNDDPISR